MDQRIYFSENTKTQVIAEGYQNQQTAEHAVDAFLQDITYSEECFLHYTRQKKSKQEKKNYTFTIYIY